MFTRAITHSDKSEIKAILAAAFSSCPWFEDLNDDELERRWQSFILRPGFAGTAMIDGGQLVAAIWWDVPSLQEFSVERGVEIATWVQARDFSRFIWIRELVVLPNYQGKGAASKLRSDFLSSLPSTTLVLTRHRSDNFGIIAISQKQGFQRTGIAVPSKQSAGIFHEFWYKII